MDILSCFDNEIAVPNLSTLDEFNNVMKEAQFLDDSGRMQVISQMQNAGTKINVGVKKVLTNIETARHDDDPVNELVELMTQSI